MKLAKLFSLLALFLVMALLASAQVTVDPNDDGCWQDTSSLRACQAAQLRLEESQAQRCTSFPEYQCAPEEQPTTTPTKVQGLKSNETVLMSGVTASQAHAQHTAMPSTVQHAPSAGSQNISSR